MLSDNYKILGLTVGCSQSEVKKAYRRLAKENHPDRFSEPAKKRQQESRMAEINAAYEDILSKPVKNLDHPSASKFQKQAAKKPSYY